MSTRRSSTPPPACGYQRTMAQVGELVRASQAETGAYPTRLFLWREDERALRDGDEFHFGHSLGLHAKTDTAPMWRQTLREHFRVFTDLVTIFDARVTRIE